MSSKSRMDKFYAIYIMRYYTALKKNYILTQRLNLPDVVMSKRRPTQSCNIALRLHSLGSSRTGETITVW